MRLIHNKKIILFLLIFFKFSFGYSENSPILHEAYTGVYLSGTEVDGFAKLWMNKSNKPYVNLQTALKYWLGLHPSCDKKTHSCTVTLPQSKKQYWFDAGKGYFGNNDGSKTNKKAIPNNGLALRSGAIWVRYDILAKWLPLNVSWDLQRYALVFTPKFHTSKEYKAQRKRELKQQAAKELEDQKEAQMPIMIPNYPINAQARYQVNWDKPMASDQSLNGSIDSNIDIFKGTLAVSGSGTAYPADERSSSSYWNYSLSKPGKFHLLKVGDTYYRNSLLLPGFALTNSIEFEQTKQIDPKQGFYYQGQTMPGTEVDVWQSGVLRTILTAGSDGVYTVNLPNTVPGDYIKLRFYYKDGKEAVQTFQVAPNSASLLSQGQSDNSLQSGYVDNYGYFSQYAYHLGITNYTTLGALYYHFPSDDNNNAGGLDFDSQILPSLNAQGEVMGYQSEHDSALQLTDTGFNNNTIEFTTQHLTKDSPIKSLPENIDFDTTPFPQQFDNISKFWSAKDTYRLGNWQLNGEYKDSDVGNLYDVGLLGSLTQKLFFSATAGQARPDYDTEKPFAQLMAYYYMTTENLLQLTQNFVDQNNKTILGYRFQGLLNHNISLSANLENSELEGFEYFGSAQWQMNDNFSISTSVSKDSVDMQLTWQGVAAISPGPTKYDDYATGTVSGQLIAPSDEPGGKSEPISGVKVIVGGKSCVTNDNGEYLISGIPPDSKVKFMIDQHNLDASLVPDQNFAMMEFRPGTFIEYNPKLDWSSGMDGQIIHNGEIPKGAKLVVFEKNGSQPVDEAPIEDNGFFVLNKLKTGNYVATIAYDGQQTTPMNMTIGQQEHWVSNVRITWS